MDFSPRTRNGFLERLDDEVFDLAVIGGGITGCGIALDASSRGLKTALVERDDFASGTSSRSSRLIHGGIRYLQHREFGLVYEALAERQRLLKMAPHLVRPLPFILPIFKDSEFERLATPLRAALWAYDLTGGARIGHLHKRIGAEVASDWESALDASEMADAFLYWDACNDDARMTVCVARTAAVRYGAVVANYCEATSVAKTAGGFEVDCLDRVGGGRIQMRARAVVTAAGVWSDRVSALDGSPAPRERIRPAKGTHIVVRRERLPGNAASLLPVPDDDRFVFTIPWGDYTIVGTTDTDYSGGLDNPAATEDEIAYLLNTVNHWSTDPLERREVTASFAGLRPLAVGASDAKTADVSRSHVIELDDGGLVSVYGGKYTTWRLMAEEAVDFAAEKVIEEAVPRSATKHIRLDGAAGSSLAGETSPSIIEAIEGSGITMSRLFNRFGSHARAVVSIARDLGLGSRLAPELGYLEAEMVYGVRHEMALHLEDLLVRRSRAVTDDANAAVRVGGRVAEIVSAELGWDEGERNREVAAFTEGARSFGAVAGVEAGGGLGSEEGA